MERVGTETGPVTFMDVPAEMKPLSGSHSRPSMTDSAVAPQSIKYPTKEKKEKKEV